MEKIINIAVADDHWLVAAGMRQVLPRLKFNIMLTASNGKELLQQLSEMRETELPDIAVIDINMPVMDGYATTTELIKKYPAVKPIALSMYDNEHSILQMLRCGAKGYVKKDDDAVTLETALTAVAGGGYYHPETDPRLMLHKKSTACNILLSQRELEFLQYCCLDMTYNEIADRMFRSINTICHYRDQLYDKLGLKTRAGLIVYALQSGLVLPGRKK